MKINKLFHWLYAALMLLPLFGVLFTSLYVSFNPNAKDSYNERIIQQKVELTNRNDIIFGNDYIFVYNASQTSSSNSTVFNYNSISIDWNDYSNFNNSQVNGFRIYNTNAGSVLMQQFSLYYDNTYVGNSRAVWGSDLLQFTANIKSFGNNDTYLPQVSIYSYIYKTDTLDNAFTYAVNQINENPLYSWAQSSFLVAPIAYITAIFGLASTSPIVTLLSYWLTISIVWLVYDLIMYLPLLVHKWIDRSIIS